MTEFLTNLGLPEILSAIGMIVTALVGYLTARVRAKNQLKIKEVDARTNMTLKEQENLAKRHDFLADQQLEFMNQMREDMRILREELNEERKRSNSLEDEVRDWRNKYLTLFDKYSKLEIENNELQVKLEKYEKRISELELDLKKRSHKKEEEIDA